MAEQVVAEIDRRELEAWAPHLAKRGLTAVYKVFQMDGADDGSSKEHKSLLTRLMVLDPILALSIPTEENQSP